MPLLVLTHHDAPEEGASAALAQPQQSVAARTAAGPAREVRLP